MQLDSMTYVKITADYSQVLSHLLLMVTSEREAG